MKTDMNPLPTFEAATAEVSVETYQQHLQSVRLMDLTLESLETMVNRSLVEEAPTFNLKIEHKIRLDSHEAKRSTLLIDYVIRGLSQGKNMVRIKATYRIELATERELPIEFFAIYGNVSAPIQVWPFLRELASSLTSRMGVPRLTLPMLTNQSILQ